MTDTCPHSPKRLEFVGIRYPSGIQSQPRILFANVEDRSERHFFQPTDINRNWYGFTTYVDVNGTLSDKSETCFYLAALEETFIIDLDEPAWSCPAAEDLRAWLLEQTTNPMQGIVKLNS